MFTNKFFHFIFLVFIGVQISCNQTKPKEKKNSPAVKVVLEKPITKPVEVLPLTYHYLPLDSLLITQLHTLFTDKKLHLILALNRIDFEHVWKADTLVVPDTFLIDTTRYAPYPLSLPVIADIPKLILFSYYSQMFAAYQNGNLVRWGPTSMGKRATPTPTGLYFTNWKAKKTVSTDNPDWKLSWYFNLDNARGVSLHQYDLPGFPASHACMRLYDEDAHWFYDWADQWILIDDHNIAAYGTPVIIFGAYPYGKRKPWLQLPENNTATHHSVEELNKELAPFLQVIEERKLKRDSVVAAKQTI